MRSTMLTRTKQRRAVGPPATIVAGVLAMSLILAACGGGDGATSDRDTDSDGGAANGEHALNAVTGQGAFFGEVMSRGAQLGAKQIIEAGGPNFEIVIADHESGLVPPAVSGTRRMIQQDGISALLTSYGAPSEAIIPLIQEGEVLSFNGGGASPGQLNQEFLYMTRMLFAWDPADGGLAWLAREFPDIQRLAVIGTQENGVETWEEKVPRIWPQLSDGGEVVITEIHDVGLTDFSSVVSRVRATDAEAIFTVSFGNDLGHMVRQFREAGVDVPIVAIEFTAEACEIAGAHYDTFVFATDFYDEENENPWNQEFVRAHQEEYGEPPEYYGANYYEMTFVLWELVRRVIADGGDPTSGVALQDALKANPTFLSVYGGDANTAGEMTFNLENNTISKPMGVFEVSDCTPSLLAPIQAVADDEDPASALVD
jgi:branched-chain amino acid transport system substrate-binding protein